MSQKSKQKSLLAPSLLSADFSKLAEEIQSVEEAGVDWLHIDVMDGHFVPNLTIGPLIVEAIRPKTRLQLDCHLMVAEPEKWVEAFAEAGADSITVHSEASYHLDRLLHQIKNAGCRAGVSLNPGSSLSLIEEVLDLVDLVLIMSVNPGFGGQKFIESSFFKIERLAHARGNRPFLIQVDGGVNVKNIQRLKNAGVDVFVAGSAIFGSSDRKHSVASLRSALNGGT